MIRLITFITLWIIYITSPAFAQQPDASKEVVTTIKPIHSLVASIMGETGSPDLLIDGHDSAHGFVLKPSQVKSLRKAKLIFIVNSDFDYYIERLEKELPDTTKIIDLSKETPGLLLLKKRTTTSFAPNAYTTLDTVTDSTSLDPHIWLSPTNALKIAQTITKHLIGYDPANIGLYESNLIKLSKKLRELDRQLKKELVTYKATPYIAYHDAYQYFEHDYALTAKGAITLDPDHPPSAKRISAVRDQIKSDNIRCMLSEPHFDSTSVSSITEGYDITISTIDEQGSSIAAGPDLYHHMMNQIKDSFVDCLKP